MQAGLSVGLEALSWPGLLSSPSQHGLTMSDKGDVVAGVLQLGWYPGEMVPWWKSRQGVATARCGAGGHSPVSSLLLILQEGTFGLWKVRGSGKAGAKAESRLGFVCLASLSEVTARLGACTGWEHAQAGNMHRLGTCTCRCSDTAQELVQGEWL